MSDTARGIVKAIDDGGVRDARAGHRLVEWSKFVGWVGFVSLSLTTRAITLEIPVRPRCSPYCRSLDS